MNTIRIAIVLMTMQRYLAMLLNLATMVIVSRLLRPEEVGLAVIGTSLSTLILSLREFASNGFLIQKPALTHKDIRAAFSVLATVTCIAAAVLAAAAPWIASSYNQPILVEYLRIMAFCALLELIVAPIQGLMQREMAFGHVAMIAVVGMTATAVVTVGLAAAGFSTMSFAWAWFASCVLSALLALYLRRDFSIFRPTREGWKAMLTFSGSNGVNQVLYRLYEAVPGLVLGRAVSVNAVGLYNRAINIAQLPDKVFLSGLMAAAVPIFSAKNRENSSLKGPYLRGVSYTTALQWPALIGIAILAHPIVHVCLGKQWGDAAPIIQIIALSLLFSFTFELNFPVLVAVGAMRSLFFRALIVWPASAVIVSIGALFGLKAMAFSLFLAVPFQAVIAVEAVRKHIPMTWTDIGLATKPSALLTLITIAGPLSLIAFSGFRFDLSVADGVIAGLLAIPCWLGGLWLTNHPLLQEANHIAPMLKNTHLGRRLLLAIRI
jgi:O-antigen/teichoic acid export membrane protein